MIWGHLGTSFMVSGAVVWANSLHPSIDANGLPQRQLGAKPSTVTVAEQGTGEKDFEITRKIRQKLVADSTLSTQAHNVKIITKNSKVVIEGPVVSRTEQRSVETIASDIAGKKFVLNRTVLAPIKF